MGINRRHSGVILQLMCPGSQPGAFILALFASRGPRDERFHMSVVAEPGLISVSPLLHR